MIVCQHLFFPETAPILDKQRWPELVGVNGEKAVDIIKKETGSIIKVYRQLISKIKLGLTNVVIIKEGSPITLDYRTDRVYVFVNSENIVISVPAIGRTTI